MANSMTSAMKNAKAKAFEDLVDEGAKNLAKKVGPVDPQSVHVNLAPEDNLPLKVVNDELQKSARKKIN